MRKIALDVGDRRIGIASSDIMGIIAGGFTTYTRVDEERDIEYILSYAREVQADTIVVGLPINMDGTEGQRAILTREFAEKIRSRWEHALVFQDERLSTVSAERMLIQADVRRDKRKKVIDKVAATIILQNYLDRIN